ncbi:DUF86 domain-containing protein [Pricia sp.]|uniref:HepT-like ribonuclease domain-containing protein n=1 Tax=Pricia sp. TaxID=2268138 RepID=UPI0035941E19
MQPKTKKYVLDIESAIDEIEDLVALCEKQYVKFENNPLAIRSLERLLEIIGEATKKALESNTSLVIANSQRIISLRNRLAHAYDSIQLSVLWSIALKDVPKLKEELERLK